MNPVPLAAWLVVAGLVSLAPRLALGWSWWSSLAAGVVAAPALSWLLATILDRFESQRGGGAAPHPPLVLAAPEPCPRCGSRTSAVVLYGQPALTRDLVTAIEQKRALLGGCLVYEGAPAFACQDCGERHGRA